MKLGANVTIAQSEQRSWKTAKNNFVVARWLACGASIVATDCKYGPAEILENGRYGILVPVGGVPEMAEAILRALDDKLDVRVLRERASVFSQENAVQQYLELFQVLHREIRFVGRN